MKKVGTLGIILMCLAAVVYSQNFKDRVLFAPGLSLSLRSNFTETDGNKSDERNDQTFSIDLPVGYFITPRTAIGLSPGFYTNNNKYEYENQEGEQEIVRKTNLFNAGIFVRNYLPLSEKFNFLIASELSFGTGNVKEERNGTEEDHAKMTLLTVSAAPGLNYAITEQFFIELGIGSLGYYYSWTKDKDADYTDPVDHSSSFGFNYNSFTFGVLFLF